MNATTAKTAPGRGVGRRRYLLCPVSLPVLSKKCAMTTSPAISVSAAFRTLALPTHQSIAALDALTAPSVPSSDRQPPQWDEKYNADYQPNGQAAVPRWKFYK